MRTPTFTGPVEVSGSEPFLGLQDSDFLAEVGYEQREYLVSGTGAIYGPGRPGATERPSLSRAEIVPMGAVAKDGVPFTTRVLVRAPRAGAPFSGTVHIEAFHNAAEIAPSWALSHGHIVESADAWVGVTVSTGSHVGEGGTASGGVELLKQVDPARYGSLELVPGDAADWPLLKARDLGAELGSGSLVDVLSNSAFTGGGDSSAFGVLVEEIYRTYAHSYDAMTQVATAIKGNDPTSPLAGRTVERLYASGASGTTIYWSAYIDGGHHDRARLPDGKPVVDAYLTFVATPPMQRPGDAVLVSVLSEAEAMAAIAEGLGVPEDSDDPPFRQYHIPGCGHGITGPGPGRLGQMSMPGAVTPANYSPADPDLQPFDRLNAPVISAIWRYIDRWVREGVPMPPGQHLAPDPSAADGVARDDYGNALGGIRTPWVEAPNAHYFARSPGNPLAACYRPFTADEMKAAYGDHQTYVDTFHGKVDALIAAGWALPSEAALFEPG